MRQAARRYPFTRCSQASGAAAMKAHGINLYGTWREAFEAAIVAAVWAVVVEDAV
jgi:hypothetical protein